LKYEADWARYLFLGVSLVLIIVLNVIITDEEVPEIQEITPTTAPICSPTPTPLPSPTPMIKPNPLIVEKTVVSRGSSYHMRITKDMLKNPMEMTATAYDLSYASCKKKRSHPEYGITYSGIRAKEFHTVAVDPKVIPLGSILYIEFPEKYNFRNGLYVAEDVGSAIKGNKIDVFFGEDEEGEAKIHKECYTFGRQPVTVYIIKEGTND